MFQRYCLSGLFLLFLTVTFGQPLPTKASERLAAFEQRQVLAENSLLQKVPYRNIGPVVQSGRVTDLEVNPDTPSVFFVAFASGGLWKTVSNGSEFLPLFDKEAVMTIGDIAVNWNKNIIWIGTGEVNSSRSSYAGNGVYKSTDGGKTWLHKGLGDSHHIGRIILHPTDPNTAWVAVLGHLYSPNEERGVFKTIDGGNSWKKVLFVDELTGAVDLVADPVNPDILFAAMWHRERSAWNLVESGKTSAIYKSIDGGETWTNLIAANSGFPVGEGLGRIGLATARSGDKSYLYAILDNQALQAKKEEKKEKEALTKAVLRDISKEDFLKLEPGLIDDYLKEYDFPGKYKAEDILRMVRNDKIKPLALVEYLENANNQLFDTQVIGAEIYLSTDEGKTWSKQNSYELEDLYSTYGYYFGQIRVATNDPERLYILGIPLLRSKDTGKTWNNIDGDNVHGDHHALWINPKLPGHLINGNDGGINISYDDGKTWFKCNTPPVGQFYAVNVDQEDPYNVYGGLQDNGVWVGSNRTKPNTSWQQSGHYEFKEIMGGDGMQVMIDPRDNTTVYTGYQFGNYFRINKNTERSEYITPKHELGERPHRFNWQTPIWLSKHNPDIIYMGAQRTYRSMNKGKDWEPISEDLTKGGKKGDVPYGTITTMHESPLKFGLIYAGTDDGNISVTRDGGDSWSLLSGDLPGDLWVTRVTASAHEKGRVYISLNGYRFDHFKSYMYMSDDYGKNWLQIGTDLPAEPVNVIKEDPVNPKILYAGTDHGLYASLDGGTTFMLMNVEMPAVAVHDLVIQQNANDLVAGTHGRSIFIFPLEYIQQLTDTVLQQTLFVFDIKKVTFNSNWGKSWSKWEEVKDPEKTIPIYLKQSGNINLTLKTEGGQLLKKWSFTGQKGLNYPVYNLDIEAKQVADFEKEIKKTGKKGKESNTLKLADSGKYYLIPGKYTLYIEAGGVTVEKSLLVEERK